jgi:hypothetical protein
VASVAVADTDVSGAEDASGATSVVAVSSTVTSSLAFAVFFVARFGAILIDP